MLTAFVPIKASAFEVGLGVYSYYNWREMAWTEVENLEMDPVLQAGPVLNLTWFHKLSLSVSLIIPPYRSYASFDIKNPIKDEAGVDYYNVHVDKAFIFKADGDLTLSYSLMPNLKIFGGWKTMQLSVVEDNSTYTATDLTTSAVIHGKGSASDFMGGRNAFYFNKADGLAIGINYSISLLANLFIIPNISILYAQNRFRSAIMYVNSSEGIVAQREESGSGEETKYSSYGLNFALSLSYYIGAANTALIFGGRYQTLYNVYQSGPYKGADGKFVHLWGVTFSAVFYMSFFED